MSSISLKEVASIQMDASLLSQIRAEAQSENSSLGSYLEKLLYRLGYRTYNEATLAALEEAKAGEYAGVVDTTDLDSIDRSLFEDE